ncbi:succinyl-CoA synthetase, beta subunit [Thermofilum adornatum 1505]|uniref:Succinyl-CoA synthetase, beta subunit n=2 Tax=Thermofilum adornatum TaxID=1365176 RepID=A0A3G1A8U0_9CREN|nr:succinyl-CoA synthetase, beta subunit [Thermofilum adornatum 1505]
MFFNHKLSMILYEFEIKEILESIGLPVEKSCLLYDPIEGTERCLEDLSPPLIVKAQVRGWGRGKAGLVKTANSIDEALKISREFLSRDFRGEKIRYVMVSEKKAVQREMYLSFMVSSLPPGYLLLASKYGGVDVEDLARKPGGLLRIFIDPFEDLRDYMVRRVASYLELPYNHVADMIYSLWKVFRDYNFTLLEINPLALTDQGILALDRKGIIDDDSLGDKKLAGIAQRYYSELDALGRTAVERGFAAVKLDGNIAVIGNGAGLTMATLDAVNDAGGKPGFFLDLGGGAEMERVKEAVKLVLGQSHIDRVLINILGGITRCDEVARGVVEALRETGNRNVKIVVRLSGFMEEEGRRILLDAGIKPYDSLEDAVVEVVK